MDLLSVVSPPSSVKRRHVDAAADRRVLRRKKQTIKLDYNKRSSRIVPLFSSVLISDCRLSIRLPIVYVSLHPSSHTHTHKHHLLVFPKKRLWMEENN